MISWSCIYLGTFIKIENCVKTFRNMFSIRIAMHQLINQVYINLQITVLYLRLYLQTFNCKLTEHEQIQFEFN